MAFWNEFLHNVWSQTRKYLKHMLAILIIYDCRTCWAVFTFRAHNVHFCSYNCCDKSVIRLIVKAVIWCWVCHFTLFRRVRLWVFFPDLLPWPEKRAAGGSRYREWQKNNKIAFFPLSHRQRSSTCRPKGKRDCFDQCCSDAHTHTHTKYCEHVGIQIYNRFILVCWCEKIMLKTDV